MSTQQDIYAAGSESHPPMLNKENYVPWSSRLLRYAKSRPNGKLIHNSILNGPYVRRMIAEPGDGERDVNVNETFHEQTDDELSERELKQIEADDQAIQTILLGCSKDIYAAVDSCETTQEIWLRVQQMMKGSNIRIQEKKAKLFNEWERFTSNEEESIESYYHYELKAERVAKIQDPLALMANYNNPYASPAPHQDQSPFNQNFLQQPMKNPEDITDPTTSMNMALALMAKAFKLNYSTPTNNNQRISSNPRNRQIAQPWNLNGYNAVQNVENQVAQNPRVQNVGNQNGLIGVQGNEIQNQIGNGNLVAIRAEGNVAGQNGNQIRCYNCRGIADLDEIEEVNANCILMANLQQASSSGTQTDSAPIYDSDGSAEVHQNYDNNEIFNMFTQEEQYTELLEPIHEPQQVQQNDNEVIYEVTGVEQGGETVEQQSANFEETRALYDSLYQNLAVEFEKVNSVNRKLKETNADLTTELASVEQSGETVEQHPANFEETHALYDSLYQNLAIEVEKVNSVNRKLKETNAELTIDARVQNFEIQFLKEATKFVEDFKSPANEADASLAKHKALELEIERLLKAVV
nr:hypothetical protein [Tanacetum cinerariifolium]